MSTGSEIVVTFSALQGAQGDVATTAARIHGQLGDLKKYLAPIAATWQGQAAEEYQAKQRQWDTAAADIALVLDQIGKAIGSANDSYQQAENANKSRWQ